MSVDRAQQAADAIDAVAGLAPIEARRALAEYTKDDLVAAIAAGHGGQAGNGGSQPGSAYVIGPYTITGADFAGTGDFVNVVQLPVGSAMLDWQIDPDTFEAFDYDVLMGQGPEFNAGAAISADDANIPGSFGMPAHGGDTFTYSAYYNALAGGYGRWKRTEATFTLGQGAQAPLLVTQTADPIRIYRISASALTIGRIDIYFVIATPPFTNDAVIT